MDPQPSTIGPGRPPLVIVGASCRAAAASAAAAGWAVHAADLFDDLDLEACAEATRRVVEYPGGLVAAATGFPPAPWCYTGGVENHPLVIEGIAATRSLAGNDSASIRRVRDPIALAAVLRPAGLRFPETSMSAAGVPVDGSFLCKPLAGAGGRGIAPWSGPGTDENVRSFWQRMVVGEPISAVLAIGRGVGRVLGVSRQLVGQPWCRAAAFAYCGSIAIRSDALPPIVHEQLQILADVLAAEAGLAGIVGADCIREPDDRITVIEVNPRPTASAELVERTTGESIMATHLAAFGWASPRSATPPRHVTPNWSKAILFADRPVRIDDGWHARLRDLSSAWADRNAPPAIADVPRPGRSIAGGAPVVSVFAGGDSEADCFAELRRRVEEVRMIAGCR